MFTLYYATQYVFQSLKLMVFPSVLTTFAHNNIALANELKSLKKSLPAFTAQKDLTRVPLSYHIYTHVQVCMHAPAHTSATLAFTDFLTENLNVRVI